MVVFVVYLVYLVYLVISGYLSFNYNQADWNGYR